MARSWGPQALTHTQRLTIAHEIAERVKGAFSPGGARDLPLWLAGTGGRWPLHFRQRLLTDVEDIRAFSKVLIREGLRSNRPGSDGSPCWVALQVDLREALPQTP